MGKLFTSLYIYIIVSLFLVSGVIEHLWPYEDSQHHLALDQEFGKSLWLLSQTSEGLKKLRAEFNSEIISRTDVALPAQLASTLENQHFLYLFDSEQRVVWYIELNEQQLLHVGPLVVAPEVFESVWPYLLLLTIVGLPVGLWSFLLWRDFAKLRRACEAVGGAQDFQLSDTSKSFFLPVTETLNAMQQRIQHLLAAQQELTSSVSHEFRTPLARLKFATAILKDRIEDEKAYRYIDNMQADVAELESLVSEMLEYARLDSQQPSLIFENCDLTDLLNTLITKLSFASNIAITVNAPAQVNYQCDPHFISRCLQNLLGNALKYAQQQIRISLVEHTHQVHILVEDDGPGIDESQWQSIFKPFTRLDKSRDKKTGGFGLGLAIVAKIIIWHKGQYEVCKSPLGGAKFIIQLNKP
ncbi:ATP-binding protein [Pseudoalteromonas mariniglutinosa]|uniref:ATP-binding protein n=1 Tax=Pseudoalteromonas mariniglutinosa TaxID=206042 RepID=UPI00384DC4EC